MPVPVATVALPHEAPVEKLDGETSVLLSPFLSMQMRTVWTERKALLRIVREMDFVDAEVCKSFCLTTLVLCVIYHLLDRPSLYLCRELKGPATGAALAGPFTFLRRPAHP
jgi:hypothetical protein